MSRSVITQQQLQSLASVSYGSGHRKAFSYTGTFIGDRETRKPWKVELHPWIIRTPEQKEVWYTAPGACGFTACHSGADYDSLWTDVKIDTHHEWDRNIDEDCEILRTHGCNVILNQNSLQVRAPSDHLLVVIQNPNNSGLVISLCSFPVK